MDVAGLGLDAAIRLYQSSNGLVVDGVAGPQTYGALEIAFDPPAAPPTAAPSGSRLAIPSIGLDRSIVTGGQSAIDQGHVVNFNGCWPGQCTVYLAGHNTTHGAVFNLVDDLPIGATLSVWHNGQRHDYRVVSKQTVLYANTRLADVAWGDLVLQTSNGSTGAWIVRCEHV